MGLDRDDAVIRRRLRMKMELLVEDVAGLRAAHRDEHAGDDGGDRSQPESAREPTERELARIDALPAPDRPHEHRRRNANSGNSSGNKKKLSD